MLGRVSDDDVPVLIVEFLAANDRQPDGGAGRCVKPTLVPDVLCVVSNLSAGNLELVRLVVAEPDRSVVRTANSRTQSRAIRDLTVARDTVEILDAFVDGEGGNNAGTTYVAIDSVLGGIVVSMGCPVEGSMAQGDEYLLSSARLASWSGQWC